MPLPFIIGGIIAAGNAIVAAGAAAATAAATAGATVAAAGAATIATGAAVATGVAAMITPAVATGIAVAIGATVIGGLIYIDYLERKKLRELLEALQREKGNYDLSFKVQRLYRDGNYEKVKVGIYENNEEKNTIEIQSDSISSDIYEGMRITA